MARLANNGTLATMLPLLAAVSFPAHGQSYPAIAKLRIIATGDGYKAKIVGTNFGTSPVPLPCIKCNITELQFYPFGSELAPVTIRAWTDTEIRLSGIKGTPGETYLASVKNDAFETSAAGAANIPGGPAPPVIKHVTLRGRGSDLKIIVNGQGFGSTPPGVPGDIDLPYFGLQIWAKGAHAKSYDYPWGAGYTCCGGGNLVTLKYASWSDTRIVIDGFGQDYGLDGWKVRKGDAAAVVVYNVLPNGGGVGPGVAKAVRIPGRP